jgi:hypothetical protein
MAQEIRYGDGRRYRGRSAAELKRAEDFSGYYFVGKDGDGEYFNADGEALRRAFARAVELRADPSPSTSRRHPIFRTLRPISPSITRRQPLWWSPSGAAEWNQAGGGYGNVVDIRHPELPVALRALFRLRAQSSPRPSVDLGM